MTKRMPHGEPITKPVLMLPTELVSELVEEGVVEPSPNPAAQFSAGDWWTGVLFLYGVTANTVTLIQGREALQYVARRLREWLQFHPTQDDSGKRRLAYRTPDGLVVLELDRKPDSETFQEFVKQAYRVLESDIEDDDED